MQPAIHAGMILLFIRQVRAGWGKLYFNSLTLNRRQIIAFLLSFSESAEEIGAEKRLSLTLALSPRERELGVIR